MNIIDVLAIVWVLSSMMRGYRIGFLHQALSFGGFIVGLLLGSWIAPSLAAQAGSSGGRLLITLISTLGLGILLAGIGESIAAHIKDNVRLKLAHTVNSSLGVLLSAFATLIIIWLLFSSLGRLPLASIGLAIQESKAIQAVDRIMPPAPSVMERFGRLISPHGFPKVFVDNEPVIDPAGPPATAEVEAAAAKAKDAMVKIEGYACGGVSVGSGFVAADKHVITNAHVIAGVREPVVIHGSNRYRAVPVWFDPKLDFAVVRVERLSAASLPLADTLAIRGQSGAILGYPGGGRLTIDPAVILGSRQALGRDIYDRGLATRQVYEIQADIDQGNSGGPLVLPDGTVAGVIFGESVTEPSRSYAFTSTEVVDDLAAAIKENTVKGTGSCI